MSDRYLCESCGRMFDSPVNLRRHIRTVHNPTPRSCHLCGSIVKRGDNFHRHVKNVHAVQLADISGPQGPTTAACCLCPATFDSDEAVRHHMLMAHASHPAASTSDSIQCDLCDQRFTLATTLRRHVRMVHGPRVRCEECGATFRRDVNLHHHKARYHSEDRGRRFRCAYCDRGFTRGYNRDQHEVYSCPATRNPAHDVPPPSSLQSEPRPAYDPIVPSASEPSPPHVPPSSPEQQQPSRQFRCTICDRSFRFQFSLRRHKEHVHRPRVGLSCDLCPATFSRTDTLQRHLGHTHSVGERVEHPCRTCNPPFTNRFNRDTHEDFNCPAKNPRHQNQKSPPLTQQHGGGGDARPDPSDEEPSPPPRQESPTPDQSSEEELPAFTRVESGFRSRLLTYRLRRPLQRLRTIPEVLTDLLDQLRGLLRNALALHKNVKVNMMLECDFVSADGEKTCQRAFKTKNAPVTSTTDLNEFIQSAFRKLLQEKEQCELVGSGWTYLRVHNFEVRVNE